MISGFKTQVRDLLPKSYQVPAKYWYGWLRGALEPEMKILGALAGQQDRVIDVGGNRGMYAYHLWRLGASVEVFEPNPVCFRVLLHGRGQTSGTSSFGCAFKCLWICKFAHPDRRSRGRA